MKTNKNCGHAEKLAWGSVQAETANIHHPLPIRSLKLPDQRAANDVVTKNCTKKKDITRKAHVEMIMKTKRENNTNKRKQKWKRKQKQKKSQKPNSLSTDQWSLAHKSVNTHSERFSYRQFGCLASCLVVCAAWLITQEFIIFNRCCWLSLQCSAPAYEQTWARSYTNKIMHTKYFCSIIAYIL